MRRPIALVIALALLVLLTGTLVFRLGLDLPWVDSFYFVVTTMTTTGYGDINLKDASPGLKIFGSFLMLASGALLAATFGLLTDYLVKTRLEQLLGKRRIRMRNHIILCGLGHVGMRILEQLHKLKQPVVVIEHDEKSRFIDEARTMNVPVLIADMRQPATLERANVKEARSLIAATSNDVVNLETGLNGKAVRADLRVVLRVFDANLASKMQSGFGIKTTFSTSALAAPAFAMAAVDPAVVGSFYIGEELVLVVELVVEAGAKLDGMAIDALMKVTSSSVLSHHSARTNARQLHPPDSQTLERGDTVVLSASPAEWERIRGLNQR